MPYVDVMSELSHRSAVVVEMHAGSGMEARAMASLRLSRPCCGARGLVFGNAMRARHFLAHLGVDRDVTKRRTTLVLILSRW